MDDDDVYGGAGREEPGGDPMPELDQTLFAVLLDTLDAVAGQGGGEEGPPSVLEAGEYLDTEYLEMEGATDTLGETLKMGSLQAALGPSETQDMLEATQRLFPDVEAAVLEQSLRDTGSLDMACRSVLDGLVAEGGAGDAPAATPTLGRGRIFNASVALGRRNVAESRVAAGRWRDRADAPVEAMGSDEIKRQEAIAELLQSERTYQRDLGALKSLILDPVAEAVGAGELTCPGLSRGQVGQMCAAVDRLALGGKKLAEALEARYAEAPVVARVADVLLAHCAELRRAFLGYTASCFHLQAAFAAGSSKLVALMTRGARDPRARSLPLEAFVLAPVQRVARYPMLISAISDRTPMETGEEAIQIIHAQKAFTEVCQAANARLRALDDYTAVERLQQQLDCRRLVSPLDLVKGAGRAIVRRGKVELIKLADSSVPKPKKAVRVELVLLDEMLLYGTQKSSSSKLTVYRAAHRSLVEARVLPVSALPRSTACAASQATVPRRRPTFWKSCYSKVPAGWSHLSSSGATVSWTASAGWRRSTPPTSQSTESTPSGILLRQGLSSHGVHAPRTS